MEIYICEGKWKEGAVLMLARGNVEKRGDTNGEVWILEVYMKLYCKRKVNCNA